MVPDDPLGRNGPRLEEFLRKEVFLRYFFAFPCMSRFIMSIKCYASEQVLFLISGNGMGFEALIRLMICD